MEPEEKLDEKGYTYLGWANGWKDAPTQVENCKHSLSRIQHDHKGMENTVFCAECKWYFNVDSSD